MTPHDRILNAAIQMLLDVKIACDRLKTRMAKATR